MNSTVKQANYDVVVVGGGNAGIVAALSAREAGAKVVVLEVAPRAARGGSTYFAGGQYRCSLTGLDEIRKLMPDVSDAEAEIMDVPAYTPDQFYSDWMRLTEGLADPELLETVVTQSNPLIWWLKQQGMRWEPYMASVGSAVRVGGRLKWTQGKIVGAKGAGAGLSDQLFDLAEKKGAEIEYETKAVKLLVNQKGKVCGVTVKDNDGFRDIQSKAVVLACGGFAANREMRSSYLGGEWEMARIRGSKYNMGDGIRMALEIGAQPEGHWSRCHGTQIDADAPYIPDRAETDTSQRSAYPFSIIVNCNGQRFVDEGEDLRVFTYAKLGRAVLAQPGGIAFQIFDSKVESLLEDRYQTCIHTTADTFEELADKMDILALPQTINEFNAAVQEGPFDPARKDGKHTVGIHPPKSNWAQKLDSPPFSAYAVTGGLTFTFGGIKINSNARVLDTENRVIPGLYAAGEMVGGLYYYNYPGGTGFAAGAVLGRLAGTGAAQE